MSADAELETFLTEGSAALFRYAFLLTGDRGKAEDLTQEALVRVYEARRRIEPGGHMAYARRSMHNLNVSWWRKVRDREHLTDRIDRDPTPDHAAPHAERADLMAAIRALPMKMRTAIVLHYYEDQTTRQIAEVLDTSEGNVRTLLSRGRAALATYLTPPTLSVAASNGAVR